MSTTSEANHPTHAIRTGGESLLPVTIIYGANGSGKSNVYGAFSFMRKYVLNSFSFCEPGTEANTGIQPVPFLFDKTSRNEPSEFTVNFVDDSESDHTYLYGFVLQGSEVIEEWLDMLELNDNTSTVFHRKQGSRLKADGLTRAQSENLRTSLTPKALIISLGAKLNISILGRVYDWFRCIKTLDYLPDTEDMIKGATRNGDLPEGFVDDEAVQKNVAKYLASFDDSIVDFKVAPVSTDDEDRKGRAYVIHTLHRLEDGGLQSILLGDEPAGIRKMFSFYRPLKSVMDRGSVLFADGLCDSLHPLLTKNIILAFLNPEINTNHAQLIMTSHDVWQIYNNYLRRDEIWLTDKDKEGVSTLYSLAEFKVRDEERHGRVMAESYLVGNYGGIPALKPMDMMGTGGRTS